jgi:hypothetical protein
MDPMCTTELPVTLPFQTAMRANEYALQGLQRLEFCSCYARLVGLTAVAVLPTTEIRIAR